MKIKTPADIAGILLGLLFIVFGLDFFLKFLPENPPPPGSEAWLFGRIMYNSGYMLFVKVLELTGGVLVAIPKTRNIGLLVLGPIIINILCFNLYLPGATGIFPYPSLPVIAISLLALFLVWHERKAFSSLLHREPAAPKPEGPKDQ
jgi:hypothetical protein